MYTARFTTGLLSHEQSASWNPFGVTLAGHPPQTPTNGFILTPLCYSISVLNI
jgi:hypothetical protein